MHPYLKIDFDPINELVGDVHGIWSQFVGLFCKAGRLRPSHETPMHERPNHLAMSHNLYDIDDVDDHFLVAAY